MVYVCGLNDIGADKCNDDAGRWVDCYRTLTAEEERARSEKYHQMLPAITGAYAARGLRLTTIDVLMLWTDDNGRQPCAKPRSFGDSLSQP